MAAGSAWSREELVLALNLYLRLPFGRMHQTNPEVAALATVISRSPSAVALRLGNFAHLDPGLDRQGMSQVSAGARAIWAEYERDPEAVSYEGERLLAQHGRESLTAASEDDLLVGEDREAIVRARVNQAVFRRLILARYDSVCCVTGLRLPELLVAAHIVPWAEDRQARLDPRNGLCLNALHDRAFERGLMVVDDTYRIRVAPVADTAPGPLRDWLGRFEGEPLRLGDTTPGVDYLRRHRARFQWSATL